MNNIIERFNKIKSNIEKLKPVSNTKIIAVSKTFSLDHIKPLINYGHLHFGENKVQEALVKWKDIKYEKKNLQLHMIGKLQSNKAKSAVKLFDFIHSLDNPKLADILSNTEKNLGRNLKYFIQVNVGNELQKSGISIGELESFYNYCFKEKNLNVIGLMVIPPNDNNSKKYFKTLKDLNLTLGLKDLSMGMSADYHDAVLLDSTYVRIGSSIFGKRN